MPTNGDKTFEEAFVRFLGDKGLYDHCCNEAHLDDPGPSELSRPEKLAVWLYSSTDSHWYARINGELCGGSVSAEVGTIAEILSGALAKMPIYRGVVYRGYNVADLDEFLGTHEIQAVVRWPGFTSATREPSKAFDGNALFVIKPKNGRFLGNYADKPDEEEVLFPSGCRFRVLAIDRREDNVTIELEEVDLEEYPSA